jgi:acyl-CoA thioesterase-1
MALSTSQILAAGVSLILTASPALAQSGEKLSADVRSVGPTDPGLSAECFVPDGELFTLAPLDTVRAALDEKRPVKVLTLGSTAMSALGTSSASYPAWLEHELERLLPGSNFVMEHRATSGEGMEDASDRIKGIVAEVEPDLVIWKVGTPEMLARVDAEEFGRSLDETVKWLKEHAIDVVLVDPQYTARLADDPSYEHVVASVEAVARADAVPLVFRSKAVRYLTEQRSNAGQNSFQLNELGYRCMAQHVMRAVLLSIRQSGEIPEQGQTEPPK